MQPKQQPSILSSTVTPTSVQANNGNVRELRPRKKEETTQPVIVRKPTPGFEGSILRRMVQISARNSETS